MGILIGDASHSVVLCKRIKKNYKHIKAFTNVTERVSVADTTFALANMGTIIFLNNKI